MPVRLAARRAMSWSAPFLLLTRSWAITPRGTSRSATSITPAPATPRSSSSGGPRGGAARLERRIDPPDIAVAAPVHEVQPTMRAVAEQQHRRVGQVHPHHGFADGELRQ